MPLKVDTKSYRGPHATHLKYHIKLGRHMTVIKAALPIVQALIEHDEVYEVDLGKIIAGRFTRELRHHIEQKGGADHLICFVFVTDAIAQRVCVEPTLHKPEQFEKIIALVKSRWEACAKANSPSLKICHVVSGARAISP